MINCNGDIGFTHAIYNPLVRSDTQMLLKPSLAETWEPADDLSTWTFHLRKGVKFHHGTEFKAAHVIANMNRIKDPQGGSGGAAYLASVDDIEAVDDYTVRFYMNRKFIDFPWALTDHYFQMTDPAYQGDWNTAPSGTGPFKVQEHVVGDHALLVRNEEYWDAPLPYLDKLMMVFMPDPESRATAVKAGQLDLCDGLQYDVAKALEGDGVETIVQSTTGWDAIWMHEQDPFTTPGVRQAFKAVVDREAFRKRVTKGIGDLGQDHIVSPMFAMYTDIGFPKRDIEKAKQLLAQAGYPDGLDITISGIANQPRVMGSMVVFQDMAKDAGIRVVINGVPDALYWDKVYEYPFSVTWWGHRSVPSMLLRQCFTEGPGNESKWDNAEFVRLLDESDAELDVAKRKAVYEKIERLMQEEGPCIIAYFVADIGMKKSTVKDLIWVRTSGHYWDTIWLEA
jgi:peptide/nickel transport system substrate-binding protein